MEKLLAYLNSLSPEAQDAFAKRCGTTVGYLRKAAHVRQRVGEGICLRVGIESGGEVLASDMRPDLDWQYLLRSPAFSSPSGLTKAAPQAVAA